MIQKTAQILHNSTAKFKVITYEVGATWKYWMI